MKKVGADVVPGIQDVSRADLYARYMAASAEVQRRKKSDPMYEPPKNFAELLPKVERAIVRDKRVDRALEYISLIEFNLNSQSSASMLHNLNRLLELMKEFKCPLDHIHRANVQIAEFQRLVQSNRPLREAYARTADLMVWLIRRVKPEAEVEVEQELAA